MPRRQLVLDASTAILLAKIDLLRDVLALELLAKLQRFGRYDARILEDVARRIRAAASSRKGESPP